MSDRPPHLRGNGLPPHPEADPGDGESELPGKSTVPTSASDDIEMASHVADTVRSAHSGVKCDLHIEPRYAKRMSDVANRLKIARERAGYTTAKAAAEAMGVKYYSYVQHENGTRGLAVATARRYARFFKVQPSWLLYGDGEAPIQQAPQSSILTPISRHVPVIGAVQAGAWSMVPVTAPEPDEFVSVDLKGFERAQLFALRVVGNSMNLVFKPGARVVVCPAAEIGVRENDMVVVRRHRGAEVETTIKEIVREPDGTYALWPRSDDPEFQEPIRFRELRDSDEGLEIIGVVVAHYHVQPLQTKPLIRF